MAGDNILLVRAYSVLPQLVVMAAAIEVTAEVTIEVTLAETTAVVTAADATASNIAESLYNDIVYTL